jgi:4-amino-4-deoxy-L-arabinose transferase-like glycosyltransferase
MSPRLLRGLLLALVVTACLAAVRGRELFVGDETKYGQVVREMRATGEVFLPTLQGTPFTHKPPVHFWLIDGLTHLFGLYSIWSFVLPSLAAYVFLLWVMARHAGPLAAFVCGSFAMIWASAQTARMDVSFTALIALAAFLLERFFDREDFRALLPAALCIAVATLIKGPMAPVIALTLFVFERLRRRQRPRGNYLPAVAVLIILPLLWVVPAMMRGGSAYTREIVVKQTVGRAVGSWVHRSPPWYYLTHAPGDLFPWFFLVVIAGVVLWREGSARGRFALMWLAAVLVPYSILSSKLDVYMMALLPPAAVLISEYLREAQPRFGRLAHGLNVAMLVLLAVIGLAGLTIGARFIKGPDASLAALPSVRGVFLVLLVAAIVALLFARTLVTSSIALGLVPLAMFAYLGFVLTPLANDLASTKPLVAALERQHVSGSDVALYWIPFLWTHDLPRELEQVHYVDPAQLQAMPPPAVIATSRAHAGEIAVSLRGYRKVEELRMIGKWFDVYRR